MSNETKTSDDGFALRVIAILQASIKNGLLQHAEETGGVTANDIVNGTITMMLHIGIIMAQRFPAEAARVAEALNYSYGDAGATEAAVGDVIAQATLAAERDEASDGT